MVKITLKNIFLSLDFLFILFLAPAVFANGIVPHHSPLQNDLLCGANLNVCVVVLSAENNTRITWTSEKDCPVLEQEAL